MAKRIKWIEVVNRNNKLYKEFVLWCESKPRKIKSVNRLAYLFLKTKFHNDTLEQYRYIHVSDQELLRIIKTPWIKVPEL